MPLEAGSLEPAAEELIRGNEELIRGTGALPLENMDFTITHAATLVSIAISLKRIADALTPRDSNRDALNIREILSELLDNTRGAP